VGKPEGKDVVTGEVRVMRSSDGELVLLELKGSDGSSSAAYFDIETAGRLGMSLLRIAKEAAQAARERQAESGRGRGGVVAIRKGLPQPEADQGEEER
jgi:hypothetical protein